MRSNVLVKVCGVREESDIRALAEMSVDYLGFIFVPESPRFFGEDLSLLRHLKPSITAQMVAVVRDAPAQYINAILGSGAFNCIQLHGDEDLCEIENLRASYPTTKVIKAVGVSDASVFDAQTKVLEEVDLCILDNAVAGSGCHFDWSAIRHYQLATPFLLAGGVGPEDVAQIRHVLEMNRACAGVDVNSKFEISPGRKDIGMLRRFLEEVRA